MRTSIPLVLLYLLLFSVWSYAGTTTNMEIGVRGGTDVSEHNLEENYQAAEVYLLKQLPWGTTMGEQTTLTSRFDIGATFLEGGGDEGGLLAVGADLVLGLWDGRMEFEIGFRPTLMLDHKYGGDNFGGGLQFTSHVGATINWQSVALNYRLQHTSNAGIYDHNPGLNLHLFGVGYRF
jgi:lipid A 3-O-deacylase